MKNLKIAMILVAAVAFFCSCGEKTVTVTMTEANETLTYDLSSAASLPIAITCTVKADAGIKAIDVTKTIKNGEEVVKTVVFGFESTEYEGMAEYTFAIEDTLLKAELAKDYTVVFDVTASDKKDTQKSENWTITVTESATPISANWSEIIYLTRPSMTGYAQIGNVRVDQSENTTIGVKMVNNQTGTQAEANTTANCAGFVVVENDEFASVEALAEAYTAGTPVTTLMLDFDYHAKAYTEMNFIANVDNAYVLVKYAQGDVCPNGWNNVAGNVYGFKYKKAETPAPTAK